jgi:hypothetical protein
VINIFTLFPTRYLNYAVVQANGGFERVTIPFEMPELHYLQRVYWRIDGIQPENTPHPTVYYLDNVDLALTR